MWTYILHPIFGIPNIPGIGNLLSQVSTDFLGLYDHKGKDIFFDLVMATFPASRRSVMPIAIGLTPPHGFESAIRF